MKKIFIAFLLSTNLAYSIEVTLKENRIFIDDQPFYIKGVCYHPVPLGQTKRDFKDLDQDLLLMKEAGINTIRVYEPIDDLKILNKLSDAGIKVVTSFGYDQRGKYDILSASVIDYIIKYKHHEAILMWELGNEYNYHPEWFGGDINVWYEIMDITAQAIQKLDPSRPVSSAHGELPTKEVLKLTPNIQIWGINIYRWDKPDTVFDEWRLRSNKPIYFSEIGADSYMTKSTERYSKGENQQAQADANKIILDKVLSNSDKNIGSFVFQFSDGLWKAGNPAKQDTGGSAPNSDGTPYDGTANEEFWGIVDINRNKKITFDVIKDAYVNFDIN
jgi:hypothetical protein